MRCNARCAAMSSMPTMPSPPCFPAMRLPERLGVYRNTVGVSLTRALRLSFPAVHKLVGEAFFEAAAGISSQTIHRVRPASISTGKRFPRF